jgi:5-methylthioadenosine/S-adenosylhomocysteine deaminase
VVYSAKSTDVTDVMVDGRWLMRNTELQTIQLGPLLEAAGEYARSIDRFLLAREGSVLSKLIAIGGAEQEESYEVQLKVHVDDASAVLRALESGSVQVTRKAHYHEYDTYFSFGGSEPERLRHREDEFIDPAGNVFNVRYRLTLTGPAKEGEYPNSVLLSRSRFIAPAKHSLRFYREYFKPTAEAEVTKDRLRWQISYRGEEFYVNIDRVTQPVLPGFYIEIKSRTWSRRDAEDKAALITELLATLGLEGAAAVSQEYAELATSGQH